VAFLTLNKAKLCKNLIITLLFEKNANFSPKSVKKLQKIVITSTPAAEIKNHNFLSIFNVYNLTNVSCAFRYIFAENTILCIKFKKKWLGDFSQKHGHSDYIGPRPSTNGIRSTYYLVLR
jgi:hypothetical protein